MRTAILVAFCVLMTLGLALGYNYGSYGSYGYGLQYPQASGGGPGDDLTFYALIGFLFLFLILFNSSAFNLTSASTTPTVVFNSG